MEMKKYSIFFFTPSFASPGRGRPLAGRFCWFFFTSRGFTPGYTIAPFQGFNIPFY